MSRKKQIILGVIMVMAAVLCTWQGVKSAAYTKACDDYDKALEVFQEYVKVINYACDKDGYIDKIKVDTQLLHANEGEKFESRLYYYTLNVIMNEKFTKLSDEEKCLILSRFRYGAEDEMKRVREECGYEKCIEAIKSDMTGYDIKYRGRNIELWRSFDVKFYNENEAYTFDTCEFEICSFDDVFNARRYEYFYSMTEDKLLWFRAEEAKPKSIGRRITTEDASSAAANTKKSSTGSSSATKRSGSTKSKKKVYNAGPRDIDDVDIESFYEDNRDEFEDFDDAWDYMEDSPEEWDDY